MSHSIIEKGGGLIKKILIKIVKIIAFIVLFAFITLLLMQEKYLFYRNGLTVSVNNSSNITIDELKIKLYLDGKEKLALTEFKKISPNESSDILYKGNMGTESQLILEYKDKVGKVKIEDVAYLAASSKLVVEIEVKSIDKNGNLTTNVKGFDGFQAFGT